MSKASQLAKKKAAYLANVRGCIRILKDSRMRINRQGTGCTIPECGSAYTYKGKRCAIGILVTAKDIKWQTYGIISNDDQSYLVTKICKNYSMSYMSDDRVFTKDFLQMLQDAHDECFDINKKLSSNDRMAMFNSKCDAIELWLNNQL